MAAVNIYLPNDLAAEVKALNISVSAVCQAALKKEITTVKTSADNEARQERIVVDMMTPDGDHYQKAFRGTWLVYPNDESRAPEPADAGACYGVALTGKGKIACYVYHVNELWAPHLETFDSIDAAVVDFLPEVIAEQASQAMGELGPVEVDI